MISFYILYKRLHWKDKGLFEARVASLTKKECGSAVHFLLRFMVVDVNI